MTFDEGHQQTAIEVTCWMEGSGQCVWSVSPVSFQVLCRGLRSAEGSGRFLIYWSVNPFPSLSIRLSVSTSDLSMAAYVSVLHSLSLRQSVYPCQ